MAITLSFVFGLLAIAVAVAITVLTGATSDGHASQYGIAFFNAGVMFSAPFILACSWQVSSVLGKSRYAKLGITGKVLLIIGCGRWLGICLTAGPMFVDASAVLIALGMVFLGLEKRAPTKSDHAELRSRPGRPHRRFSDAFGLVFTSTLNTVGSVKPIAVGVGAFVGFIFPYFVSFWFKVSFLGDVKQPDIDSPSVDYMLAYFMLFVCGPLASGAVTAHFSKRQSILHAVFAALVGWLFYAWLGAGFLVGILFVVLGVVGATCWKKFVLD